MINVQVYPIVADEQQTSSLDKAQESGSRGIAGEVHGNESEATNDLNAAKVAAMKAAELGLYNS